MGNSLTCGSPFTTACLGATDPRYDPSVSNDLIEQQALWSEYAGHWGPQTRRYSESGKGPRQPQFYDPVTKDGWPYKSDEFIEYRRISVEGTRLKSQAFFFYGPAPAEFCDQTVPEGMQNTVGDGVCGENGNVEIAEQFGVSSYEKDGSINIIWMSGGSGPGSKSGAPAAETRVQAVDDGSVFWNLEVPGYFQAAETFTFTGEDRDVLMGVMSGTDLRHEFGDERFLQVVSSSIGPRTTGDDFLVAVRAAFDEHKVPLKEVPGWVSGGRALPECLAPYGGTCPTESDWCEAGKDPSCTESPYQETGASLNGQGIALVVVCVVVALTGLFFAINRKLQKDQSDRIRSQFAGQVARRINHQGSVSQLEPEVLAEEFERMTTKNDGRVGKADLWNFVSSGKAGNMNKNDFDALFAAMDVNNDGSVSFLEFCAFMVSCGPQFQEQKVKKLGQLNKMESAREMAALVDSKKVN